MVTTVERMKVVNGIEVPRKIFTEVVFNEYPHLSFWEMSNEELANYLLNTPPNWSRSVSLLGHGKGIQVVALGGAGLPNMPGSDTADQVAISDIAPAITRSGKAVRLEFSRPQFCGVIIETPEGEGGISVQVSRSVLHYLQERGISPDWISR